MKLDFAEIGKIAVNLIIICLAVGFCLSLVDQATKGPIKENEIKETMEARQKLLSADKYIDLMTDPERKLSEDQIKQLKEGKVDSLVKAMDKGKFVGYIVETSAYGYSSKVQTMYAVSPNFELLGATIKSSAETPGLGEEIKKPSFIGQFKDISPEATMLKVDSDKGSITAITGATISSRAVSDSVHTSLETLMKVLSGGTPQKSDEKEEPKKTSKSDKIKPVQINYNPFSSKVYACEKKIAPEMKKILPADKYIQVMPHGFKAIKKGKTTGYVVKGEGKGYEGPLSVVYSVDNKLRIMKVKILKHSETPDYILKLEQDNYLDQFKGKTLKTMVFKKNEAKSGNHISAVTGATYSSQGVFNAIKDSLSKLKASLKK